MTINFEVIWDGGAYLKLASFYEISLLPTNNTKQMGGHSMFAQVVTESLRLDEENVKLLFSGGETSYLRNVRNSFE
jgi:hypothetical protein